MDVDDDDEECRRAGGTSVGRRIEPRAELGGGFGGGGQDPHSQRGFSGGGSGRHGNFASDGANQQADSGMWNTGGGGGGGGEGPGPMDGGLGGSGLVLIAYDA